MIDKERFLEAVDTVIIETRDRNGIGRLAEKVLHASLKLYLDPDRSHHEVKVGSHVADICNDDGIVEIQTGSFTPLKPKLAVFLPEHHVTVAHPIANKRRLIWIDQNGEFSNPRTSPVKRQTMRVFGELVKILPYLTHENFCFKLVTLDLDEYRFVSKNGGKGRGTRRYERIPTALCEELVFSSPKDYAALLPKDLPDSFDSKTFSEVTKLKGRYLSAALKVLTELGLYTRHREGKSGYRYEIVK